MDQYRQEWLRKAAKEPSYAIAVALLEVAHMLDQLGFNSGRKDPGCLEKIAMILQDGVDKMKFRE